PSTRRTESVLRFEHCVDIALSDPVPPSKVVLPAAPVQPLSSLAGPGVVAALAIGRTAGLGSLIATEVLVRLDQVAVRTPFVSEWNIARLADGLSNPLLPLPIACPASEAEAVLAISSVAIRLALI